MSTTSRPTTSRPGTPGRPNAEFYRKQAKALLNVLQQNVSQYESAFGEIRLEPRAGSGFVQ